MRILWSERKQRMLRSAADVEHACAAHCLHSDQSMRMSRDTLQNGARGKYEKYQKLESSVHGSP